MIPRILLGQPLAERIEEQVRTQVSELPLPPHFVILLLGNNPASLSYVKKKQAAAQRVGITCTLMHLAEDTSEEVLLGHLNALNANPEIHGYIVQLPLPPHISVGRILSNIDPKKDLDGFHPLNAGKVFLGEDPHTFFPPATAEAILALLEYYDIPITAQHVVIIGKSTIVGRPLALLLMNRDATVTVCHQKTTDLESYTKRADIIISATGVAHLVKKSFLKPNSVVIDVGFSKGDGKIAGDLDVEDAREMLLAYAPVPGGVGPVTVAKLLENTVKACRFSLSA